MTGMRKIYTKCAAQQILLY